MHRAEIDQLPLVDALEFGLNLLVLIVWIVVLLGGAVTA